MKCPHCGGTTRFHLESSCTVTYPVEPDGTVRLDQRQVADSDHDDNVLVCGFCHSEVPYETVSDPDRPDALIVQPLAMHDEEDDE